MHVYNKMLEGFQFNLLNLEINTLISRIFSVYELIKKWSLYQTEMFSSNIIHSELSLKPGV